MKRFLILPVMLGILPSLAARGQDQQKPGDFSRTAEGQVLAKIIGAWQIEAAPNVATEMSADRQINQCSLKGRWLEGHRKSPDGSDSAMVMSTYDSGRKTYVAYLFGPAGIIGTYQGKWDADMQQMTWSDRGAKGTTTSMERLTDPNTLDISGSVQDGDGKKVKEWSIRFTRLSDNDAAAASSKPSPSKFQQEFERKVLSRYIGQWHGTLMFMGREKQIDYDTTWSLQGRWIYSRISSSDGKESLTMTTFDAKQQAYLTWSFSSDGSVEAWKGVWDNSACRMTWTHQNAKGGVVDVDQFIDDDTIEISSKNQDSAGRTLFEANEHVKRK